MKKVLLFAAFPFLLSIFFICAIVFMFINVDNDKKALAASAQEPSRVTELMLLKAYGVPYDIIMMITTYISENAEEAQKRPFIFSALEFLIMHEEVKEKLHISCAKYFEDGSVADPEATCRCVYITVETNTYKYREEIEEYIGEAAGGLTGGNLLQAAQDAADELSEESPVDDIRIISFEAVWFPEYGEAIKRCGVEDEEVIKGFLELHEAKYFIEWLNDMADSLGVYPGESTVVGGSTHNSIAQALQRPDLVNMDFFGGFAIIPVPSGSYTITSEFGPRDFAPDPFHTGLDFAADPGTPIYSAMDGIVLMRVTNMNSFGHHIVIYHGGGITTMYAHMSAFGSYKSGDSVKKGDVIGYVGRSGLSTGPHLHFEYQTDGYASNPRMILPPV